jgi:D-proline reductase (dithiol) PrdB
MILDLTLFSIANQATTCTESAIEHKRRKPRRQEDLERMALEYLPIMAESGAPKPPRVLMTPSKPSWCPVKKPVRESRIALLTSAALRLAQQLPFTPKEDLSYRLVSSDPSAGEIVIDHHSGIGRVPRQDPEIVFPRTALAALARRGIIGEVSPFHVSFMGGVRRHKEIENELAPAIAGELQHAQIDLALLVPY